MGLFDARCGVSRISTLWSPRTGGRHTCSMFLLEELEGSLVPWTPPIRGTYDRYGGLELWPEDHSVVTEWAGERLWSLWQRDVLVTSWPEELRRAAETSKVERMLKHGAETVYNAVDLRIEGRKVAACLVLDDVAAAIGDAVRGPSLNLAEALGAWFPAGGAGRRHFADAPPAALSQLTRYAHVAAYVSTRGGFTPIRSKDLGQHSAEQIRRSVHEAWNREEGPVRRKLDRLAPEWTSRWRARLAVEENAAASELALTVTLGRAEGRAYSPKERFEVGEVIEHPRFGKGLVDAQVEVNKIRVRFTDEARVLVHRPRS